jgi:hypothetical protein
MSLSVSRLRIHWLPIAWTAGCLAVSGLTFFTISWPYVDVHNNLREATTWSWGQYVHYAFSRGVEYRPLLTLALKATYQAVGLHLGVYQALVLVQFAAVLALLMWLFQPIGLRRGVAAVVALSCLVGLHTSHVLFLFVPLNAYSGALVLQLAAMALAFHPRTRGFDWIFLPLTLVALFLLESSLMILPLLVVLWWRGAPGASIRGVASAVMAFVIYAAARVWLGTPVSLAASYVGTGLGFSDATPERLRNLFEHAPWLFWIYNVVASLLTVLFSEPRAGTYRFIASLLRGETALWQWVHVLSSLLTTLVIVVSFVRFPPISERDRLLRTCGLLFLILGSFLGFLYTRDRIGLSAGVGYAMLLFVAVATMLERVDPVEAGRDAVGPAGVGPYVPIAVTAMLVAAWTVRVAETDVYLRDTAWDFHLEWTDRYADLGGSAVVQTPLMIALRSVALRTKPDDPKFDPAWTYALFERQFNPAGEARATVDEAADAAVAPLSLPFDIRWKADVDEAMRQQVEAELGLTDAQQVTRDPRGRTWEYRLRTPTRDRVRAIVVHAAVEDTGRIDVQRFEVVQ